MIATQLALWAEKLRDVAALGLHFSTDIYNRDRYRTVQDIAMAMFALATARPPEEIEPLRAAIFARPTPLAVGDAAVIDDAGRILLVRRADNGCWAMPGGALEVGETPAEGVLREVLEETGVHCWAVALVGVFDSRCCGTISPHHMYQFTFLCRPHDGQRSEPPSHAQETLETGWFTEDALPENLDPGHRSRIPVAFCAWRGEERACFDIPV